jgi:hypothetical protein
MMNCPTCDRELLPYGSMTSTLYCPECNEFIDEDDAEQYNGDNGELLDRNWPGTRIVF